MLTSSVTPGRVIQGHQEFSLITRDRMELGACKWHRWTCIAKAPQLTCNLAQLGYIKVMTWPSPEVKFWNWPFKVKRYIFWTLSTSATRWCLFYFVSLLSKKLFMENQLHVKKYFFLWWPLESKVLTLGQIWSKNVTGAWRELSNAFLEFFLAIILLEIIANVCEKTAIFSKFDLWWPLVTSILTWPRNDLYKSWRSRRSLYNAVCRMSLRCVVFEISGGGRIGPPPDRISVKKAGQE